VVSAKGKHRQDGRKSAVVGEGKREVQRHRSREARPMRRCVGVWLRAGRACRYRGECAKWRGDWTGEAAHDREARSRWTPNGTRVLRWRRSGREEGTRWRAQVWGPDGTRARGESSCKAGRDGRGRGRGRRVDNADTGVGHVCGRVSDGGAVSELGEEHSGAGGRRKQDA
jgi:hypothetical protein